MPGCKSENNITPPPWAEPLAVLGSALEARAPGALKHVASGPRNSGTPPEAGRMKPADGTGDMRKPSMHLKNEFEHFLAEKK